MTKKKTSRQKHQKDVSVADTSEEELKEANYKGKVCPHVVRALNFARVKKILKTANISVCSVCTDAEQESSEESGVWLCLQCGNRGCGQLSTNKHALQHFKTIHSDCHALALGASCGVVWCYDCDDEVQLQQSRNLRQCVEFLMKMKGQSNTMTVDVKKSSTISHPSLLETVLRDQTAVKSSELKAAESKNVNKTKKEVTPAKFFVKGIRNLGNTCFFNAVMQNLNQTYLLSHILEKSCALDYSWEVPQLILVDDSVVEGTNSDLLKIPIPRQFPLATSLSNFYKQMNQPSSIKSEIVNPSSLFSEISKKSPQFKHFLQQDSHELLRQLLDGVRQDEVKRQKKAILRHFDIATVALEEVDEETKKLIKAYGCYASHTLVEKIFGGLLISTVLCEECKMSSQVFEPFMDMSLPLFEEKHQDNCDQPYLDGGQQQDYEPLRNRKCDVDINENNEYVLTKPKKDPVKPSKYQERKMRQLARKEKKKKNVRGKKLGEASEEQPQGEEDDEEKQDENGVASEDEKQENEHNGIDHPKEDPEESSVIKPEDLVADAPLDAEKFNNVNGLGDEEEKETLCGSPIEKDMNCSEQQSMSSDTVPDGFCKNSCSQSQSDSQKTPDLTVPDKCESLVLFDEIILIETEPTVAPLPKCNGDIFASSVEEKDKPEVQAVLGEPCTSDAVSVEPSIESLTEQFNNVNISTASALELDERMQALGLQVKEVRIRRDSDRQGSILDSSQSLGDETNLASCESREDSGCNDSEDNWSHSFSESQTKQWISKSLLTLKPRNHNSPSECSVDSCLTHFTKPELLTGSNKFRCEKCTEMKIEKTGNKKEAVYTNASKQLLIFSPPAILTLHLKRFQQVGMSLRKVNRFVEFPLVLDIASYCSSACLILPHMATVKEEILYSLYGIVEHSGRLTSGHYTAFVKVTKRTLNENFMCHLPLAQCDLEQLLQKFSKFGSDKLNESGQPSCSDDYRWYYISDTHVREADEAQVLKCQAYLLFYERIK